MPRKKRPEEPVNHERWMISYADFITLLFAFFVVMYSISSVNEGKYRVVAKSLTAAFGAPIKSLAPIQIGSLAKSMDPSIERQTLILHSATKSASMDQAAIKAGESDGKGSDGDFLKGDGTVKMEKVAREIEKSLQQLIDRGLVEVRENEGSLEIEIRSSVLFTSGSGEVSAAALSILRSIANILGDLPNIVHVEGYTDDRPISTFLYPSNWELSAARSSRVVRYLIESGIDPLRLVSLGYGEYHPVTTNETTEGRSKNRRVVLVVKAQEPEKRIEPLFLSRMQTTRSELDEVLVAVALNTEPPVGTGGQGKFPLDPELLKLAEFEQVVAP